jgi:hypothetical protein
VVESSRRARRSSHTLAPGGAERERVHAREVEGRETGRSVGMTALRCRVLRITMKN